MGEIRAKLLLENQRDRILADAGHLDAASVRRVELDTLVDTGAVMLLLPQDVVEALGLPVNGRIIVTLANDEKIELPRARHLSVTYGNRQMDNGLSGRTTALRASARAVDSRAPRPRSRSCQADRFTATGITVSAVAEAEVAPRATLEPLSVSRYRVEFTARAELRDQGRTSTGA